MIKIKVTGENINLELDFQKESKAKSFLISLRNLNITRDSKKSRYRKYKMILVDCPGKNYKIKKKVPLIKPPHFSVTIQNA